VERIKKARDENRWKYAGRYKETIKKWRKKNKKELAEKKKIYFQENKEILGEKHKIYVRKNREVIAEKQKEWSEKNRDKLNEWNRKYVKERVKSDPNFKVSKRIRSRISNSIKRQKSTKTTIATELLGCSMDECRHHLEKQFTAGMTWDNHGKHGWHIDHIKPCASFDLTDIEQQKQCFHYTNLQPLWAEDNLKKGCNY
jgi:hypothetical protein